MGSIKKQSPVKLIIGFIFKEKPYLAHALRLLENKFGPRDFTSETLEFTYTDYYEKELGKDLFRIFVGFKKLIRPEDLPAIKLLTNRIEKKLSGNSLRTINIDPGYLELAKLVLATTKNYCHRIYIGRGIYAEVTLTFKEKSYCFREWTYPDYRSREYLAIFDQIRKLYAKQIA